MTFAEDRSSDPGRHRGTRVDHVVGHLRDGILNGRFAPGQRLIEADLTAELGVSRGSVREAFRRLSAEGLIEIVPNRGALVRRLSFRETEELFQIRSELEALAARQAAVALGDAAARRRFEAAIAPIWNDAPRLSSAAYFEENKQFHEAVAAASGNSQLATLTRQLQLPLIMFQVSGALTAAVLAASVAEHRRIATCILDGDAAAADREVRRHLERAAAFTREMPPHTFRPSGGSAQGL